MCRRSTGTPPHLTTLMAALWYLSKYILYLIWSYLILQKFNPTRRDHRVGHRGPSFKWFRWALWACLKIWGWSFRNQKAHQPDRQSLSVRKRDSFDSENVFHGRQEASFERKALFRWSGTNGESHHSYLKIFGIIEQRLFQIQRRVLRHLWANH